MLVRARTLGRVGEGAASLRRSLWSLMEGRRATTLPEIGQPTPATHPEILSPGELAVGTPASEFAERRARLLASLPKGSVVVACSAPVTYMTGVIPFPYRPATELRYLTGVSQPGCVAVMSSGNGYSLFTPDPDDHRATWDGPPVTPEGARAGLGCDESHHGAELGKRAGKLLSAAAQAGLLFCDGLPERGTGAAEALSAALAAGGEARASRGAGPGSAGAAAPLLRPLSRATARLRWRKSESELSLLRESARLASAAVAEAMRDTGRQVSGRSGGAGGAASHWGALGAPSGLGLGALRRLPPGVASERLLAAGFESRTRLGGAERMSYPPVVGAGPNACVIHYSRNDCLARPGQLVLMDAGCELGGYASDVTRAWPVSGTFSPAQRELYEAVLEAHERCVSSIRPGSTLRDLHVLSVRVLSEGLVNLGLGSGGLSALTSGNGARALVTSGRYREFYPHSVGHWLGLDTHDSKEVSHDTPLVPGVVLTIEPGLYIPNDSARFGELAGTGIRIEDDIAVTPDGRELLSCMAPVRPDDVERLVREGLEG